MEMDGFYMQASCFRLHFLFLFSDFSKGPIDPERLCSLTNEGDVGSHKGFI